MLSRISALLAAAALCIQAVPAAAQSGVEETTAEQRRALGLSSFLRSDLVLILGAIGVAVLINLALIAADGDDDEDPVSP